MGHGGNKSGAAEFTYMAADRDWSRLTTETTLWSVVEIDDFWWVGEGLRNECLTQQRDLLPPKTQ